MRAKRKAVVRLPVLPTRASGWTMSMRIAVQYAVRRAVAR